MNELSYKELQGLTRLMVLMNTSQEAVLGDLEKKGLVVLLDQMSQLLIDIEKANKELDSLRKKL